MTNDTRTFTFERTIHAPPADLYRALTNATALREWLSDVATTSPKEGGRIYLAWNDGYYTAGAFTALTPGEEVAFTWHGRGEPGPSAVRASLTPEDGGTHLLVEHSGLGAGDAWSGTRAALERAWPFSLENLASVMETGEDLRFTRRPMLGVIVGDFDAGVAEQLGVPVSQGIRLDALVEGMGAAAAGLEPGDVIVGIAGREVVDWPTLSQALSTRQAGDTVEVIFYRGPEKHTVDMTLSGRPIPQIPKTLHALADVLRQNTEQVESELRDFFDGVGEAEADFKPSPDVWSAKETLAHLIHSERGTFSGLLDMIAGHEPWYDDWGGNVQASVAATVVAYPTVDALLAELGRHHVETAALVRNLPQEFMTRKGTYWRMAYNLLEAPYHHRSHMQQMQETVEAARRR